VTLATKDAKAGADAGKEAAVARQAKVP